jgi:hypothetical protein
MVIMQKCIVDLVEMRRKILGDYFIIINSPESVAQFLIYIEIIRNIDFSLAPKIDA